MHFDAFPEASEKSTLKTWYIQTQACQKPRKAIVIRRIKERERGMEREKNSKGEKWGILLIYNNLYSSA